MQKQTRGMLSPCQLRAGQLHLWASTTARKSVQRFDRAASSPWNQGRQRPEPDQTVCQLEVSHLRHPSKLGTPGMMGSLPTGLAQTSPVELATGSFCATARAERKYD
eukprot:15012824-Alexandrium_andersonii.AAC.1